MKMFIDPTEFKELSQSGIGPWTAVLRNATITDAEIIHPEGKTKRVRCEVENVGVVLLSPGTFLRALSGLTQIFNPETGMINEENLALAKFSSTNDKEKGFITDLQCSFKMVEEEEEEEEEEVVVKKASKKK